MYELFLEQLLSYQLQVKWLLLSCAYIEVSKHLLDFKFLEPVEANAEVIQQFVYCWRQICLYILLLKHASYDHPVYKIINQILSWHLPLTSFCKFCFHQQSMHISLCCVVQHLLLDTCVVSSSCVLFVMNIDHIIVIHYCEVSFKV